MNENTLKIIVVIFSTRFSAAVFVSAAARWQCRTVPRRCRAAVSAQRPGLALLLSTAAAR